jgi:putative ABC transport system ATP-binding protein
MDMLRKSAVRPDRAVIVVTHDNRVFHFGDRIARMDDGQLVEVVEKTAAQRAHFDVPQTEEVAA